LATALLVGVVVLSGLDVPFVPGERVGFVLVAVIILAKFVLARLLHA
jgi:hypothetical protein